MPQVQRKGLHLRKEATIRDSSLIQNLLDSSSVSGGVPGHRQLLLDRPPPRSPHPATTTRYSSKTQSLPMYTAPPYSDLLDISTRQVAQQLTGALETNDLPR